MGNQGKPVVGIPRWLTAANLLGIVLAFTLAIPFGARASHQPAPANLTVVGRPTTSGGTWAPTAAKLRWTDAAVGTTEYALQRSTSPTFNAGVVEWRIAKNTFEFWDETFTRVGTFYYRIRSIVGADASAYSNTVSLVNNSGLALPPAAPPVPTELAVTTEGNGARFSWKDNSTTETFFRIERAVAEQGQNLTWQWRGNVAAASSSGTRPSFLDLDPGADPTYRVTVFNGKGSARSYAQACPQCVPGVDAAGVMSAINNVGSNIPNVQSLVPSNATGIVSPFVSMATGLTSGLNPAGLQSSVNNIVSPFASTATGLTSNIAPSAITSTLNTIASATGPLLSPYTALASGLASSAGSVLANPTGLAPNLNNYHLWFGIRNVEPKFYLTQVWLLPPNCASPQCTTPPADSVITCNPVPSAASLEYCYWIDTDPTS